MRPNQIWGGLVGSLADGTPGTREMKGGGQTSGVARGEAGDGA